MRYTYYSKRTEINKGTDLKSLREGISMTVPIHELNVSQCSIIKRDFPHQCTKKEQTTSDFHENHFQV